MKNVSLLVWLTQLGFSVGVPLGGFVLLAVWLHQSCGWGIWVIWAGIFLGLYTAFSGLRQSLKTMGFLAKEEKKEPPVCFNDHD